MRRMVVKQMVLLKNPRIVDSRLKGGEAVLLHLDSGAYHELNPLGAAIWDLLDGTRTPPEIAQELNSLVEDAPADLEEVIVEFLDQMRRRDLIR
jgi:hypothetical protein